MRSLAALVLLTSLARADFQSAASPGPLFEGHKSLDGACDKCHVPFKGIPSSSCLTCHTETQKHIASGIGTHARWEREGQKCSACHHDHRGRNFAITPAVQAQGFDHLTQTGVALEGKHAKIACASCHKPGPHGPRWTGLITACIGCHAKDNAHQGALGGACDKCHTAAAWRPSKRTLADHKLDMGGGHKGLQCAACHDKGRLLQSTSSCGDCHAQKHGGTSAPCATCHNVNDWKTATFKHDFCTCILPGKHQTTACLNCHPAFKFKPTPFACAGCHVKERPHEDLGACAQCHSALSWKTKAFDHNKPKVGFKIEGKHAEVGCENCHTKKGIFRGAPKNCEGCHKVPKHGDFGGCAKCHSVAGWQKTSFDHDKTAFPLDGNHLKATCQGCHAKFPRGAFKRGPNECVQCHGTPHGTQFGARLSGVMLAANERAPHLTSSNLGCRDCHSPLGWRPSTIDVARHASFGFVLKGKHAAIGCMSCHAGGTFVTTPHDCNQCHFDRHRGRVGGDCAKCHDENSWKKTHDFVHARDTGFTVDNSHAGLPCAACHGAQHEKLAGAKSPVGCATCHTPKHGDQFGADCTRCHKTTKWSVVPRIDHSRTMFPLERRHLAVACVECHNSTRGKIDPNCRTCHGDPHRGRTRMDCSDCHQPDRWSLIRFDHNRTIFPLRGHHFTATCAECHVNDQFTGVRAECINCHRGDRQRADLAHVDHRGNSPDCSQCHTPFRW